jgi:hypothetical protein
MLIINVTEVWIRHLFLKVRLFRKVVFYRFKTHALKSKHPRFDAKAWLPFKMAQGTVKWSIRSTCIFLLTYFKAFNSEFCLLKFIQRSKPFLTVAYNITICIDKLCNTSSTYSWSAVCIRMWRTRSSLTRIDRTIDRVLSRGTLA